MKASEVRIGNKLFYDTFDIDTAKPKKEIVFVTPDIVKEIARTPNHRYEPIPITPQWLLAAGFAKDDKVDYFFDKGKLTISIPSSEKLNGRVYFNSWAILEICPKNVHQLQNLYHALTGHELEFDLTKIENG